MNKLLSFVIVVYLYGLCVYLYMSIVNLSGSEDFKFYIFCKYILCIIFKE